MPDNKTVTFDASQYQLVPKVPFVGMQDGAEALFLNMPVDPHDRESRIAFVKAMWSFMIAAATPAAQSAGQEAARYFVHDNEGGYEEYGTDAERAAAHKSAISGYLDDGWSEEVDSVVSGIVTHKTVKCNVEQRPESCVEHPEHDGDNCDACDAWNEWPNHDFDYTCSYEPEALYTAPANAEDGGANLYYVQDTRSFVGNCLTWWGKDFRGYVTRMDEAGKYTREEAERICQRDTDKMWPCSMIDPLRRPTIDFQHLPPDDERIAAIAAKSTKRATTSTLRE